LIELRERFATGESTRSLLRDMLDLILDESKTMVLTEHEAKCVRNALSNALHKCEENALADEWRTILARIEVVFGP
jgi:hypothetical protein